MSMHRSTTHGPPALGQPRTATTARRRRGRAVAAFVAVGVLAVSACGDDASDASDATTSSTATGPPPPRTTAGTGSPTGGAFDAATVEQLDELVRQFQDVNQTPGALIGVWSPEGTYVSATGVSDIATEAPLEPDMQFKIASQTKSFTGNLVLQLVSEGKVSLDDHISKWIEGVPNGDEITIRQLLNHTSGLADGFTTPTVQGMILDECTVEELLTIEATFPPVAAARREVVLQQLRLQPARSDGRAGRGPGSEHGARGAHHRAVGSHPDIPGDLGQRSHRAVHPRLRDRRPRPHRGADGRQ